MDRKRGRYNARARQSIAGGASHKKRRRKNVNGPVGGDSAVAPQISVIPDPNAEIISLKPLEQKELERKERVRQQVRVLLYPIDLSPSFNAAPTGHSVLDGDRRQHEPLKKEEKELGKVYRAYPGTIFTFLRDSHLSFRKRN